MNQKKMKLCALFLTALGLTGLQAQQNVSASGGNATGSGGSATFTVGQSFYSSSSSTNGSVTAGVQQTYVISPSTGIDNKNIDLSYKVFPNPTTDYLTLKVLNFQTSGYSYQLFDMSGKMLESNTIVSEETSISMQTRPNGNYLLKVVETKPDATNEVKTFKIIKK